MRRNAENANLANIFAVFKDEHARDIGKAILVIKETREAQIACVYVCVVCTRVCCVCVWGGVGGKCT
jgi:hypothetical protein